MAESTKRQTCKRCKKKRPTDRFGKRRRICRDCFNKWKREVDAVNPWSRARVMLHAARRRSKKQGVPFDLTREWIHERLEAGRCEMTGITFVLAPVDQKPGPSNPYAPSIDRINPGKGYTKENCRVIVMALNAAMGCWGEKITRDVMERWFNATG